MKPIITSASRAAVLLFIAKLLFSSTAKSQEISPACQATIAKVDYGTWLKISDKTKSLIDTYRSNWKNLCDSKAKAKVPMSEVFAEAKQIEADFKKIFESFNDALLNDANFDPGRIDELDSLVSHQFPRFVPAFHGAFGEHEYFSPSVEAFRDNIALGNSEDRIFFESDIPLEGDFPPFIRKTWNYGGCAQYGDYDWTGALKSIARVKAQVKNTGYLNETSVFEQSIFRELTKPGDSICTCKAKESVMDDLLKIAAYAKTEAAYSQRTQELQKTIDGVKSGAIKVNSETEKRCSGG